MTILGRPEAVEVVLEVINNLVVEDFPISSMVARWLSKASNEDHTLARIRQASNANNTHATITPDPWRHRDALITMFVVGENAEDVQKTIEQIDLDGIVAWNLFPPRDAADFFEGGVKRQFEKEFDTTIDRVGKHFVVVGRRENVKQTKEEVGLVLRTFARRSVPASWL
ncbi:hypothetical protein AAVH_42946 [Aphelenchoides avenae]|nr:hypothetical protein AAVH_42946 [Aphelenchus avenae]